MALLTLTEVAERLIDKEPCLAIVLKNAAAGLDAFLYKKRHLLALLAAAGLGKRSREGLSHKSGSELVSEMATKIDKIRFTREPVIGSPSGRVRFIPDEAAFPVVSKDVPDIAGENLLKVVDHLTFFELLTGTQNILQEEGVDLPRTPKAVAEGSWAGAMMKLPEDACYFRLTPDHKLFEFLSWFTTTREIESALSGKPNGRADKVRDVLGLVDLPLQDKPSRGARRTWLFILHLPGAAVQAAGHYRPSFVEALRHRRFMCRSSHALAVKDPAWGQTADLERLEAGNESFDGVAERVSFPLYGVHFGGMDVRFTFCGELRTRRGHDDKSPNHWDCQFAKRM